MTAVKISPQPVSSRTPGVEGNPDRTGAKSDIGYGEVGFQGHTPHGVGLAVRGKVSQKRSFDRNCCAVF
jgi:hypothetical protein